MGDTPYLNDGRFSNGFWSPHSFNGYVSLLFNTTKNVKGVRFTLITDDASGSMTHDPSLFEVSVFQKAAGATTWSHEVHVIERKQANNVPIFVPLNYNTKEILVWGSNQSNLFGMSELEVYGH
jgi:hypothetical protein